MGPMADELTREQTLRRLQAAMDAPVRQPGSEALARDVLRLFAENFSVLMAKLVDKIHETLADGQRHDTLTLDPSQSVAVSLIVWPGSYVEVQIDRVGKYLDEFGGMVKFLIESGVALEALLQIDVYVTDDQFAADGHPQDERPDIGVEYTFAPAELFGSTVEARPEWRTLVLNSGLLTQAERAALETLAN